VNSPMRRVESPPMMHPWLHAQMRSALTTRTAAFWMPPSYPSGQPRCLQTEQRSSTVLRPGGLVLPSDRTPNAPNPSNWLSPEPRPWQLAPAVLLVLWTLIVVARSLSATHRDRPSQPFSSSDRPRHRKRQDHPHARTDIQEIAMHTDATPQALQVPPRLGQNATAGTTAPAIPGNAWISSTLLSQPNGPRGPLR